LVQIVFVFMSVGHLCSIKEELNEKDACPQKISSENSDTSFTLTMMG
jgi:hypothetical protein